MDTRTHTQIAHELAHAEKSKVPIKALTTVYPDLNDRDAYAIQLLNSKNRLIQGETLSGFKIGLTSKAAQIHFGVFKPDFGHLFEEMCVSGSLELHSLIQPKIEGEIAFVLGRDIQGPSVRLGAAMRAIDHACASLEIIDSRIEGWKIKASDTIADNGSSARYVLGEAKFGITDLDLRTIGMVFSTDDEITMTAAGAAVMGDPLNAVVFLINELGSLGIGMKAGQVILSGSLGGMIPMHKGKQYEADFHKLGKVGIHAY